MTRNQKNRFSCLRMVMKAPSLFEYFSYEALMVQKESLIGMSFASAFVDWEEPEDSRRIMQN